MKDFTYIQYSKLLSALSRSGYKFQTFEEYINNNEQRIVVIRHDVDSWPSNALKMAKIEAENKIAATYYFRKSPLSFNDRIIKEIVELGHEIGYHYEDLATQKGDYRKAIDAFQSNLEFYRQYYPVKTIAMHGRPLSGWDNLDLWKKYDFHDYGIIAEPYLTLDFEKILYLTDTGSCWDGDKYSVRDFVDSHYNFSIHSTNDLIRHFEEQLLPDQILLNMHPSRWNDNICKWLLRFYILTLPKYQAKKWLKAWRGRKK
jgi:tetratricopeptide (TPR) repeat protein